ncbi:hypothetical protein FIBSPDRAFT_914137 [Athelia psychrophila]|uniref:Uncharacterized protein n=1 Tax=Athelia psychrophila TaxID=1759441 RepID=A0A165Y0J2_9AGAM|nr:hypothetical protein FIBSPDRAFT_914137 [Fibularhizoctonia sp. CBS 109695]
MLHNRNTGGKNQHEPIYTHGALAEDETLIKILNTYHKERLVSNKKIVARLASDHSIIMSLAQDVHESSVKRCYKALGLVGKGPTTCALPHAVKEQMVVDQLNRDPAKQHGLQTIMQKVAFNQHTHLTNRKFASDIMHLHPLCGGPAMGHDKLYKIGLPIWAKWLGAWVVTSNHIGKIIVYLFLCLVEKFGGLPLQASTDCGSETTKEHDLVHPNLAICTSTIFHPEYDLDDLPAHIYLSWVHLRLDWGDNVVCFFNKGIEDGPYNPNNAQQYELCKGLWPKLLLTDLDKFMEFHNGDQSCDRRGALLDFVAPEFAAQCEEAYNSLGMTRLTLENVWHVFTALYPLIYQ